MFLAEKFGQFVNDKWPNLKLHQIFAQTWGIKEQENTEWLKLISNKDGDSGADVDMNESGAKVDQDDQDDCDVEVNMNDTNIHES